MKVLVIGSGGREDALVWKIAQSKRVKKIYAAPGNAGIAQTAKCLPINADDIKGLYDFAVDKKIDLTVVGPEVPLVSGIVDLFRKGGLRIFGPDTFCAQLEGSKVFAKELADKFGIPTAEFKVFTNSAQAKAHIERMGAPCVVKADGLAAGKGVIVASTVEQARRAVEQIMEEKVFGKSGQRVIVEERLVGEEASIMAVTDGDNILTLASSQDHKRAYDNDEGENTGGMGAYSPAGLVKEEILQETVDKIILPTIKGLSAMGHRFTGVLYAGIMIVEGSIKFLEFNVRLGDPETQAILPRLKGDIVELMERAIDGTLSSVKLEWDERPSLCVVLASGGYPGSYTKGGIIEGLDSAGKLKDVILFHAGTKLSPDKKYITDGGRVLGVTALGNSLADAFERAYNAVSMIKFDGMHYRRDIGRKALARRV